MYLIRGVIDQIIRNLNLIELFFFLIFETLLEKIVERPKLDSIKLKSFKKLINNYIRIRLN